MSSRRKQYTRTELLFRLLAQTIKRDGEGCWEWTGYTKNGYGVISLNDAHAYLHRLSWRLHRGPIPEGLSVLHRCDNKRCVRPDHLFVGTQQDNVDDMHAKERHVDPPIFRGTENAKATKEFDDVEHARSLRASGLTQRAVADLLGVSQSTVWRWIHRATRVQS